MQEQLAKHLAIIDAAYHEQVALLRQGGGEASNIFKLKGYLTLNSYFSSK
ncbi:hypothetical protein [Lentibacillus sp. CBA3610]|nr:hypothetical protein [Lentibacillus sp. CBA3610]